MLLFCLASVNTISNERAYRLDQLLSEIAEGNSAALAEFYELTRASVYGFVLSILKNTHDSEDVLQDCYLAISHGAAGYRSKGKPMAWVHTIARNLCLQKLREHQKAETLPPEDWALLADEREALTTEDKLVLAGCMKRLTDEERQIVVLHALSGLRHREIARLLDLPLPTVLSKYNRSLKKLQKYLEEESEI